MKRIIFGLLLIIPFLTMSQTKTVVSAGSKNTIIRYVDGLGADSILQIPTGNGAPGDISRYTTAKNVSALYYDSTGDNFYMYSPVNKIWNLVRGTADTVPSSSSSTQVSYSATAPVAGTPLNGTKVRVVPTGSGAFTGKSNYIATWDSVGVAWTFSYPNIGDYCYDGNLGVNYIFTSTGWQRTVNFLIHFPNDKFGVPLSLGTRDNFGVQVVVNGTPRLRLDSIGKVKIPYYANADTANARLGVDANGFLRITNKGAGGSGSSYTFSNGLKNYGSYVGIADSLFANLAINTNGYQYTIGNTGGNSPVLYLSSSAFGTSSFGQNYSGSFHGFQVTPNSGTIFVKLYGNNVVRFGAFDHRFYDYSTGYTYFQASTNYLKLSSANTPYFYITPDSTVITSLAGNTNKAITLSATGKLVPSLVNTSLVDSSRASGFKTVAQAIQDSLALINIINGKQTILSGTGYAKFSGTTPSYITAIPNTDLANSAINIAGNSTFLGGSVTQDAITGLSSTGIIKRTATNTLGIAISGTDYVIPSTLNSYVKYTDTSTMLSAYLTEISSRVKYSDTAAMLSNYRTVMNLNTSNILLKLNISDTASMIANYPLKDGTRTTSWTVNGPITATSANVTGNLQWRGNAATSVDSIVGIVAGSNQLRTVPISQISIVSVNIESAIASYNGSATVIVSADPSYPGIYYYSTGTFTPTAHFIISATGIGTGYWLYRYTPFAGLSGVPTTLAGYGITDGTKYKTVATYALMVADGTPSITTVYEVVADENKGYSRSTYIWKPSGNREWVATTTDN